jgi:hypothetical protein
MPWVAGASLMVLLVGCEMPSPNPSASPSPTSAFGSASPITESPVSSPTDEASVHELTIVAADDRGGRPMSLTIVDPEGLVATARAATPKEITPLAERANMPSSTIAAAVAPGDPPGILIVWVGSGCDKSGTVTLSAETAQIVVAPDPRGGCDTIAEFRGFVLTFTIPIDVGAVRPILLPTVLLGA